MDPLSQLPLECLQHIFKIIACDTNTVALITLSTLLRVSRYIALVALPFLYRNPYACIGADYIRGNKRECTRGLLACVPSSTLPLTLAHCLARDPLYTQAPRPTFDYLGHVRHLNPLAFRSEPLIFRPDKEPTVEELVYLQGEEYTHLRQSICVLAAYVGSYSSKGEFLRHLHNVIVYREVVWSLAFRILDQLESLTIPLSDIDRYLQVVDRLSRLDRVNVSVDEVYESGDLEMDESTQLCKDKAMQTLLQFIEDHVWHFPGRLQTVNINDSPMWPRSYNTNLKDVQLQIYRRLPPMPPPAVLSKHNWARLMTHPLTTNLRHVKDIVANHEQWQGPEFDYPRLLQRCRNLNFLDITPLAKGSFKWAVQEKVSLGENGGLVPLQRVQIRDYYSLTDEIDDIAFAFSYTLQYIRVDDIVQGGSTPTIRIGQGWVDMPKLTHLTLDIRRNRLVLDPLLLTHCPNLIFLDLMDDTTRYWCPDIVSTLPAQLGQLSVLRLQGWPALTFHPSTLHSMSKLGSLRICSGNYYMRDCFIPPVEELEQSFSAQEGLFLCATGTGAGTEGSHGGAVQPGVGRRPLWTWDWVLPQLSVAEFMGEFAYRFGFRMLRGCPSLETLMLKITTERDTHTRILTQDDFFVTGSITADANSTSRQQQLPPRPKRIIAPALKTLQMTGPWVLDDTLVPLFFHGMFPKLKDVTMPECSGFSHRALVECLKGKAKHVVTMNLGLPEPSMDEQKALGLYPRIGRKRDHRDTLHIVLRFQSVEYLVLRDSATATADSTVSPAPAPFSE
ncbi:hypothetical protein BG015_002353 [Linnemannia schmuckeri]|uniref:F-box domain-containing protein n=1 Tax=Linnemannia schmuckeri TaxID=64567 RepID=A0A9P5V5X6_9FUNG|nr:hypothetical protein BG015_002353 [Linnemannia schmuckeri]